jgi:hypothetical protein
MHTWRLDETWSSEFCESRTHTGGPDILHTSIFPLQVEVNLDSRCSVEQTSVDDSLGIQDSSKTSEDVRRGRIAKAETAPSDSPTVFYRHIVPARSLPTPLTRPIPIRQSMGFIRMEERLGKHKEGNWWSVG